MMWELKMKTNGTMMAGKTMAGKTMGFCPGATPALSRTLARVFASTAKGASRTFTTTIICSSRPTPTDDRNARGCVASQRNMASEDTSLSRTKTGRATACMTKGRRQTVHGGILWAESTRRIAKLPSRLSTMEARVPSRIPPRRTTSQTVRRAVTDAMGEMTKSTPSSWILPYNRRYFPLCCPQFHHRYKLTQSSWIPPNNPHSFPLCRPPFRRH